MGTNDRSERANAASNPVRWYADAGHEWLAVPLVLIRALGIGQDVSVCSYVDHQAGIAYLEGDCDAALFIGRIEQMGFDWNHKAETVHYDGDCFIRGMPRYSRR